jgi:arylsulfatase A-like enzyme
MNRRDFLWAAGIGFAAAVEGATARRLPNIVLILADNLGYGDLGCYGSAKHRTPHTDRMAREGTRFANFYVSSGVCTPSRASIMTGCYPRRVGLHYTDPDGHVLRPISHNGLNPDETTIAEVLKGRGYATAIVGKWHLGDQLPFLPTRQGFDYYFGIPYSDDMVGGKRLPSQKTSWPPLPLMENEQVIEAPVDRELLTKRYTEKTIEIVTRQRNSPFFIYLAHAMPGSTPAPFASEQFRGKSANGPYGDSVEEIDWSTGQILSALKRLELDDRTLVVSTSDNGAVRRDPPQGSNLPLRGWGYTTAEGGQRVPCIARWPGKVPAGAVCDAMATTMDLLPTFAGLAGTRPPQDRIIDGKDIWPLLAGQSKESPHEAFYYYGGPQLQAVRSGRWKLFLPLEERWTVAGKTAGSPLALYDLEADIGETTDVAAKHPDIVRRLTVLAAKARGYWGDMNRAGKGQRPAGRIANPTPRVLPAPAARATRPPASSSSCCSQRPSAFSAGRGQGESSADDQADSTHERRVLFYT